MNLWGYATVFSLYDNQRLSSPLQLLCCHNCCVSAPSCLAPYCIFTAWCCLTLTQFTAMTCHVPASFPGPTWLSTFSTVVSWRTSQSQLSVISRCNLPYWSLPSNVPRHAINQSLRVQSCCNDLCHGFQLFSTLPCHVHQRVQSCPGIM